MNWMRSREDKQYPEPDIMKTKEGLLAPNRKVRGINVNNSRNTFSERLLWTITDYISHIKEDRVKIISITCSTEDLR